jgi:TonB family protein
MTLREFDGEGRGVSKMINLATGYFILLILSAMIYPISGVADEFPGETTEQQTLPPFKISKVPYYPDAARRDALEGKVLVAFDIVPSGRAAHVAVIFSDQPAFEKTAMEFMANTVFEVSSTWATSKDRFQRYHMGFLFCIPPSGLVDTFGIAASPVTVSASRIPGSPIRNPPTPGATGRCSTG